jgi:hypothetical protein
VLALSSVFLCEKWLVMSKSQRRKEYVLLEGPESRDRLSVDTILAVGSFLAVEPGPKGVTFSEIDESTIQQLQQAEAAHDCEVRALEASFALPDDAVGRCSPAVAAYRENCSCFACYRCPGVPVMILNFTGLSLHVLSIVMAVRVCHCSALDLTVIL